VTVYLQTKEHKSRKNKKSKVIRKQSTGVERASRPLEIEVKDKAGESQAIIGRQLKEGQ